MILHQNRGSRPRMAGSSMIELMISVAIIAVLIALLIPAIQSMRNAAKKVQNQNNIKQIMLAVLNCTSQNDGKLPTGGNFPGLQCNYTYYGSTTLDGPGPNQKTYTYPCSNNMFKPIYSIYDYSNNTSKFISSGGGDEDPSNARNDWVDGSAHFVILPFTENASVYHASYGLMEDGTNSKYWDDGSSGCHCSVAQQCNYHGCWCPGKTVCPPPVGWVHKDLAKTAKLNSGWQAGKVSSVIKSYVAYGDPTADFPGFIAPLSYPLFSNPVTNIESANTAYTPYVTEGYTGGCMNPTNGYASQIQYLSWATSRFTNLDLDSNPATPLYYSVSSGSAWSTSTVKLWAGVKTTNLNQNVDYYNSPNSCGLYPNQQWVQDNVLKQIPGSVTDITSKGTPDCPYVYVEKINGVVEVDFFAPRVQMIDYTYFPYRLGQAADYSANPAMQSYIAKNYDCNGRDAGNDYCHQGEWWYMFDYTVQNHQFFQDHPTANKNYSLTCSASQPMAMTPGSLNIGFLDGSVKSIGINVDREAWFALIGGQAPTTDW